MQPMSFRERFIGLSNPIKGGLYAPSTIGAPMYVYPVDYSVFKKTKEEKLDLKVAKATYEKRIKQRNNGTETKNRKN